MPLRFALARRRAEGGQQFLVNGCLDCVADMLMDQLAQRGGLKPMRCRSFPDTLPHGLDASLWPPDRRSPAHRPRDQGFGRAHGRGESTLGCTTRPCRAPQARHHPLGAYRFPTAAEAAHTAIPDVADVPRQSRPGSRLLRFLHGSHGRPARTLRSLSCSLTIGGASYAST